MTWESLGTCISMVGCTTRLRTMSSTSTRKPPSRERCAGQVNNSWYIRIAVEEEHIVEVAVTEVKQGVKSRAVVEEENTVELAVTEDKRGVMKRFWKVLSLMEKFSSVVYRKLFGQKW